MARRRRRGKKNDAAIAVAALALLALLLRRKDKKVAGVDTTTVKKAASDAVDVTKAADQAVKIVVDKVSRLKHGEGGEASATSTPLSQDDGSDRYGPEIDTTDPYHTGTDYPKTVKPPGE